MRSSRVIAALVMGLSAFVALGQTRQPIVDVHLHTHNADREGRPGLPNPVTGKPSAATTDDALMLAAFAEMRKFNIVVAVGFSARDPVERWRIAADGHILGGVQIDKGLPMPDLEQLRQDLVDGKVRMIGEIGAQYLGLTPADRSLEPYLALAEEFDVPVGFHSGISAPNTPYECCPQFRIGLGNPALLEEVLIRHPRLRVYIMHAGWPYLEETVALMSVYPQVYADLSVINWIIPQEEFYAYLRALLRAGLGKRLMFGSDQMIWPEAIGRSVETVERALGVSTSVKRDILYNNAVRFFRLQERDLRPWR